MNVLWCLGALGPGCRLLHIWALCIYIYQSKSNELRMNKALACHNNEREYSIILSGRLMQALNGFPFVEILKLD